MPDDSQPATSSSGAPASPRSYRYPARARAYGRKPSYGNSNGRLDIGASALHYQDGWRTPMIEDPEHPAHQRNGSASYPFAQQPDGTEPATIEEADEMDSGGQGHASEEPKHLTWKQRMKHVTWAWFTLTMATGGIANVLHTVPYRFNGLETIGVVFMLTNIILYIIIWAMIITRFTVYPWTFKSSLTHPTESLFAPAFAVSFGTILINIVQYGSGSVGKWLTHVVVILYWVDCGLAIALSITIYLILWSTQTFTIAQMTPIWIFPAYPLLIIGPHAANLCQKNISTHQAIRVLVGGFTIQGTGFLVSLTIYSAFVYRLMTQKLPAESLRPGMFVSVGPSAFTVSGTIGMANDLRQVIASTPNSTFMDIDGLLASQILRLVANWASLWMWGLAWWFFFVSLLSNIACLRENHRMPFAMAWFSFVFPQTALTTATFAIAQAFNVEALNIFGCVMTVLLIIVWAVVVGFMIKAIITKQILWPGEGEDKSEGGFQERPDKTRKSLSLEPLHNASGTSGSDARQVQMNGRKGRSGSDAVADSV